MSMNRPLEGIKVVDFSTYAAVPVIGRIMADWGADVIKIESTAGDPWRFSGGPTMHMTCNDDENPAYDIVNGSKKHIAVNLKTKEGQEIIYKLLAEADVFTTNVRVQALKKLGLDYDTLHENFPELVWSHISGFGSEGPDCNRPGFDIVSFWARSGAMIDLVQPNGTPITPPYGFGDIPSGVALLAGTCAALLGRQRTGKGEKVEVSLYGNAIWSTSLMQLAAQDAYQDPWPKARTTPPNPLGSSYRCKDGEWLILGILEPDRYWGRLATNVLGLPEMAEDERFLSVEACKANVEFVVATLDEAFAKKDRAEWEKLLIENDLAFDKVMHFREIPHDPQAWANKYVTEVTFRSGNKAVLPNIPIHFGGEAPDPISNVSRVGEDTEEILKALDYSDEEIASLLEKGVIAVRK